MTLKLRYFTIQEAETLLPQVGDLLKAAQETKLHIEAKVDAWRKARKKMSVADEAVVRGQVDFLAARLENELNEIAAFGCVPKDLDQGLVDFPARVDGREGYLCWKMGETKINYWHNLTEGYTGRRPLTKSEV